MPFVYLLRCADGTLYAGHTGDLASREKTHNDGLGAKYTADRRPVRMVYAEEHASFRSAITRERQGKRWTARKKETLVAGDQATLKVLSRQQQQSASGSTFTWKDLLESKSANGCDSQQGLSLTGQSPRANRLKGSFRAQITE